MVRCVVSKSFFFGGDEEKKNHEIIEGRNSCGPSDVYTRRRAFLFRYSFFSKLYM